MPLTIAVRETSSVPLEVDTIRLEDLQAAAPDDAARTLIQRGNQQVELGEFFDVSGSAADSMLIWQGDCSRVKLIGAGLTTGIVQVEGDAGMHLGAQMSGGEITVRGNAADWVGAEMSGGRIRIQGNAGHLVGAAYRGGRRGMTGGEILVDGNAGNEIGHTLRRGFIAVGGRTGDALAFNMIAGTIILAGGDHGIRPGAGMRRGSIVYLQHAGVPDVLPTFRPAGLHPADFLHMYFKHLADRSFPVPEGCHTARFNRFTGDHLETGLGEILIRASGAA